MKKYYYVKFGLLAIVSTLVLSLMGSVSMAQVPYLTAVSSYEIDLGSIKPGDTVTFKKTLLIGHSNMSSVTVSLSGTDLTGEDDVLPTTYKIIGTSYNQASEEIRINLSITVKTEGPGDEGSSDAGIYEGSFTVTLSGSL